VTEERHGGGADDQMGRGIFMVVILPMLLMGALSFWLAMRATMAGGKWWLVRLLAWPGAFLATQFLGAWILAISGFIIVFFNHDLGNFLFANSLQLSMYPLMVHVLGWHDVWFSAGLDPIWIVVWQFSLWYIMGRHMLRAWTIGIYDLGFVRRCQAKDASPGLARGMRLKLDRGYAKANAFYAKRESIPLFSALFVAACGENPVDYYECRMSL